MTDTLISISISWHLAWNLVWYMDLFSIHLETMFWAMRQGVVHVTCIIHNQMIHQARLSS